METWLFAMFLEAQAQYIAEPFEPHLVTRDEHVHTCRRFVFALYDYLLEHP